MADNRSESVVMSWRASAAIPELPDDSLEDHLRLYSVSHTMVLPLPRRVSHQSAPSAAGCIWM